MDVERMTRRPEAGESARSCSAALSCPCSVLDAGDAQCAAHGLDLTHARQEHQDRPLGGFNRALDRARHVRQVLAAHAHALIPDSAHGLDAARRGSVAQLQRENIARNSDQRGLLTRRGAQEINRA